MESHSGTPWWPDMYAFSEVPCLKPVRFRGMSDFLPYLSSRRNSVTPSRISKIDDRRCTSAAR